MSRFERAKHDRSCWKLDYQSLAGGVDKTFAGEIFGAPGMEPAPRALPHRHPIESWMCSYS
jgi:hypothetical protein